MSLKRKNGKSVYSGDFTGAAPVLFAVRAEKRKLTASATVRIRVNY